MRWLISVLLSSWTLAGTADGSILISTEELTVRLEQGGLVLIDAESPELYRRAHLPGALNLHYLDLDDAEENAKSGLPITPRLGASKLEALGVTHDTPVVVYDEGNGRAASGVWYILRFLGQGDVRVLDGGFRQWLREGRVVTQEAPVPAKASYAVQPRLDWAVKTGDLIGGNALILDARSLGEYSGKETGGARQAGHIPGAKSLPWSLLAGELSTFKPAEEMRRLLLEAGIAPERAVLTYCNPGLGRSTFLLMALESLGYDRVRVYPGSWIEWASDPSRPIAR